MKWPTANMNPRLTPVSYLSTFLEITTACAVEKLVTPNRFTELVVIIFHISTLGLNLLFRASADYVSLTPFWRGRTNLMTSHKSWWRRILITDRQKPWKNDVSVSSAVNDECTYRNPVSDFKKKIPLIYCTFWKKVLSNKKGKSTNNRLLLHFSVCKMALDCS